MSPGAIRVDETSSQGVYVKVVDRVERGQMDHQTVSEQHRAPDLTASFEQPHVLDSLGLLDVPRRRDEKMSLGYGMSTLEHPSPLIAPNQRSGLV